MNEQTQEKMAFLEYKEQFYNLAIKDIKNEMKLITQRQERLRTELEKIKSKRIETQDDIIEIYKEEERRKAQK